MKTVALSLLLSMVITLVQAQKKSLNVDSLKFAFSQTWEDTSRVNLSLEISKYYLYSNSDSALAYALPGLELARKSNFKKGEVFLMQVVGEIMVTLGNYPKAMEIQLKALQEAEKLNDLQLISYSGNYLGNTHYQTGDYLKALFYFRKVKIHPPSFEFYKKTNFTQIGACHLKLNNIDSASYYIGQAYEMDLKDQDHHWSVIYYHMGAIQNKMGHYARALDIYREGMKVSGGGDSIAGFYGMASVLRNQGKQDSAIYYAKRAFVNSTEHGNLLSVFETSSLLTKLYKAARTTDSAFKYQEIMLGAKDSLFSQEKLRLIQNLSFNEELRRQQQEQERKEAQLQYINKVKVYSLLGGLAILAVVAFILYRNNQNKQRNNELLRQQKQEIERQRLNAEKALEDLKTTQNQLIQREKMASLGELTAGIAHEIQNPLNFVNNFSEVSFELLDDLEQEAKLDHHNDVFIIIAGLRHNLQKILQHGKRADIIVKNMLQHSRSTAGEKQLTDLNTLADEYLRLAYHGLRAKDKSFTCTLDTNFDPSLAPVEVVPQEIGRVLLNLYNNAFYAVQQKAKLVPAGAAGAAAYQPTVKVTTRKNRDKVELRVWDNGEGMSEQVKTKIFQPFFTTKPTGQGTGLGLSLSYDIITKGHGGELNLETKEGEFAEFQIKLPLGKVM